MIYETLPGGKVAVMKSKMKDYETIVPDIAETAEQMANGEIDVNNIPF